MKVTVNAGDVFNIYDLKAQLVGKMDVQDGQHFSVVSVARIGGSQEFTRIHFTNSDTIFSAASYVVKRVGQEPGPRDCGEEPYLVPVVYAVPYENKRMATSGLIIKFPLYSLDRFRPFQHDKEIAAYAASIEKAASGLALSDSSVPKSQILRDMAEVLDEIAVARAVEARKGEMRRPHASPAVNGRTYAH